MADQPNLLIIISDQHNPHVMGNRNDPWVDSPNLDALAEEGVGFNQTYCAAPVCVPSRMTFLSSRRAHDLSIWINGRSLHPDTPTFAHSLGLAGYETVLCGRMHFNGPDQHHGFERRLVGDVSGARQGDQPLFENKIPEHTTGQSGPSVVDAGPGQSSYMAYDQDVTRAAQRFLTEPNQRDADRPFCLVVGYVLPHNPYICPPDLFEQYMDTVQTPVIPTDDSVYEHRAMSQWRQVRQVDLIHREHTRRARAAYYGLVSYMDQQIGQVLSALDDAGLKQDTAVTYTSDHGEMAGEHGLWWKESFYEGSVGVPMIWSWPEAFARGATCDGVTSLLDIAPTVLELTGAPPLPGMRGQSLVPILRTGDLPADWINRTYSEMHPRNLWPARMVREGRWKLNHYHGFDHPQLFNLEADPGEHHDLGRDPDYGEIRNQLLDLVLDGWDGRRVAEQVTTQYEQIPLMQRWARDATYGQAEVWHRPENCNGFEGL